MRVAMYLEEHVVIQVLSWLVLAQACNPAVPPPPPYAMVTNTLEFNASPAAVAVLSPYIEDSLTYWVNDPFQVAAMVQFRWLPGNWSLPDPPTGDGTWWPVNQSESYRQYAQDYGTSGGEFNIQFHSFFVGHMSTNTNTFTCQGVGTTYGFTLGLEGVPNQYVWQPEDRATFMFTEDIEGILGACGLGGDGKLNAVVGMIAHELGHQRAGLTHTDDPVYYEYHVSSYAYTDIMRESATPTELSYSLFRPFCATDEQPPPEGNTASCKGVLVKNRAVQ